MLGYLGLVVLFALLILAMPWWPHSRRWNYWAAGAIGLIILIWLILIWLGWIALVWPWPEAY
ncbi:DUF3309 family protein [Arenibaculum sp.]|jgi:hypothetical protein|uniref:DUF3309 family protein n=1 Tax=Arenibaculum sp. TaxID=2865862 RepID=UPI002E107BB8|nr:DUF3309 family protein [Arenibaculum sp.]